MDNVVELDTPYVGPIPPEKILKAALEHNLKEVVVIGETQRGTIALYGSSSEPGVINWYLDCAKKLTMDACFVEDEE